MLVRDVSTAMSVFFLGDGRTQDQSKELSSYRCKKYCVSQVTCRCCGMTILVIDAVCLTGQRMACWMSLHHWAYGIDADQGGNEGLLGMLSGHDGDGEDPGRIENWKQTYIKENCLSCAPRGRRQKPNMSDKKVNHRRCLKEGLRGRAWDEVKS